MTENLPWIHTHYSKRCYGFIAADYDNKLCLIIHPPNQEVVGIIHQKYYQHLVLDASNKTHKKSCVKIHLTKQDLLRTKSLSVVTRLHSVVKLWPLYSTFHYCITTNLGQDCGLSLLAPHHF